jgi:hypothetical protein
MFVQKVHFPWHPHHVSVTASGCNYHFYYRGNPSSVLLFSGRVTHLVERGRICGQRITAVPDGLEPPIMTHSSKPEKAASFG